MATTIISVAIVVAITVGILVAWSNLYPFAWLRWRLGAGDKPVVSVVSRRGEIEDRTFGARVIESTNWKVTLLRARTAWENRRDQSTIRVTVVDEKGGGLSGIPVALETMPSVGQMYVHPAVWGLTGDGAHYPLGYVECYYPMIWGKGGTFRLIVAGEVLVEALTTVAVPNEYPCPPGSDMPSSWRPTSGPGTVSYDVVVEAK